ncbi:Isopentenyl-diphosphate Delta-isomerase [Aphelenchoides besseyi]|nr:Isopentenyl-diphosphate Delta-isomerase [Aphelenchoides besseyi]
MSSIAWETGGNVQVVSNKRNYPPRHCDARKRRRTSSDGSSETRSFEMNFIASRLSSNVQQCTRHFASRTTTTGTVDLDPVQVGYLNEPCILVDEHDRVIGRATKAECHRKESASLHRAFSVFLFNSRRELLLQERSKSKITFPSVWTNTCCSHPLHVDDELQKTENFVGIRRAAIRKLAHELNIVGLEANKLDVVGRAFLFSVLGAATFAVFVQTFFLNYSVPVEITVSNVRVKQVNDYAAPRGRSDLATMYFTLHADLAPVFNWNVKELYVFLSINEITLWDKYYKRFENVVVNEEHVSPYYYFADDGTNLLGRNVSLVLRWTVVPNAGYMRNVNGGGEINVPLPKSYNW